MIEIDNNIAIIYQLKALLQIEKIEQSLIM